MTDWFRAFMDAAPEVYFRYALAPSRRFAYISRAVEALTGHPAEAFHSDPAFCVPLIVCDDRHVLRQIVRARRALTSTVRLLRRDGVVIPVSLRTVPVVRGRQVIAIEGVAATQEAAVAASGADAPTLPVQQRLTALLYEVHDLLHGTPPPRGTLDARANRASNAATMRVGAIELDSERMMVTLEGDAVTLTPRELLVLKYLLDRRDRVVTREQLLKHVWGYRYTGDVRTVDVHVSRLRRKLPPLARMLRAVKHVGYRLDSPGATPSSAERRIANI